jgi:sialate O-acetylesterase
MVPLRALLLIAICLRAASLMAEPLRLPSIFANHMVLQQNQRIPVWGWCTPNAPVTVHLAAQTKSATADASGQWKVHLDPIPANANPQTFTVSSGEESISLRDVLVGEVWLCAGQSNMAMTVDGKTAWLHVGGIHDAKRVVETSADNLLRQFRVEWKTDTRPQSRGEGNWTIASPEATPEFSATGYFFAKTLREHLKAPVAIINASFGGSSVEGWTSREALTKHAEPEWASTMNRLIEEYENHDSLVAKHVEAVAAWESATHRNNPNGNENDARWLTLPANDAAWRPTTLPAPLSKLDCPNGGIVWLRREIDLPEEFGQAWRLDYPACKAFSTIYLNGTRILEATSANHLANAASRPTFPKGTAKPGKNTLLIKLHGYSGNTGITAGKFSIVPFNPNLETIPLTGEWFASTEAAFPPLTSSAPKPPAFPTKGTLHWMPVPSQFNAMLHPIIPYAIRGATWYQGESNVGKPHYGKHLQIMINDWRNRWNQDAFPFHFCVLPGFGPRKTSLTESPWAECRNQQLAALALPNTSAANLIDTAEDGDLHPLNKHDAGTRLANVALANTYGINLPWSGPIFSAAHLNGSKVRVDFQHTAKHLTATPLPKRVHPNLRKPDLESVPLVLTSPDSEVQGFALCAHVTAADGSTSEEWHHANARIDGTSVVVWSDAVPKPVAIRYAWADHPVCNLANSAGLPAFPFRHPLSQHP